MTRTADKIPLLVTMDLEIASDHDLEEQSAILERLLMDLDRLALPITIFVTADAGMQFKRPLRALARAGHEVGCHGLTHALSENYRTMAETAVDSAISAATLKIGDVVGSPPRAFRGPFMTTSSATQRVLTDKGYLSDFSVCAQRVDLLTARGRTQGWLTAPRTLYHPSAGSPYRRGLLPLWVVPMRCIGAPFMSALVYLVGVTFAVRFFEALLSESRRTGAPIVYLFHSYEFTRRTEGNPNHGPWYHRLYLNDREERYRRNLSLLETMVRSADVRPSRAGDLWC
jgi:hypothetical protein